MKHLFTLLAAVLLTATTFARVGINTTLNTLQINEGDATPANWVSLSTASLPTYTINTFYADLGGYVIEVNSDGTHGLVVAMKNQGYSRWYKSNDVLSDAYNHDIFGAKFLDWRMPTKRELKLMYDVYSNGNGANLNPNDYWSSTEEDYNVAWRQYFPNGLQFTSLKSNSGHVRAVRAF